MTFDVIGSILILRRLQAARPYAKSAACGKCMAGADGENARAWRAFDWLMAPSSWLSYTGTKLPESAARNSRSSIFWKIMAKGESKHLVVCIENDGYSVSLEKRKIYVSLSDTTAQKLGLLRVIDESGEDYLYPKAFFRPIDLPPTVKKAVLAAA